ncbi:uncharacterized protein LOC116340213 [Contarinia nasturtii]|uniref:uncharacterized protein LOC116340213 n=1 Tax=Contarinia nasturtii TaxID=265458 RepID=UPI0012D3D70A|nr:uncharacterized protein LOC116340213 [Contarinia nasturtii]
MNKNSCIKNGFTVGVAIAITLLSNCVVCHETSANVNRMWRMTDHGPLVQLQRYQKPSSSYTEINTDQRNTFKDRFNNDKIVFDHGDLYDKMDNERTTVSSPIINNNPPNNNETYHQYSDKGNGEYVFSLTICSGIRHIERGDFEERDGHKIFVVRGFFEHINKDGIVKLNAYVFDHTGYHDIPVVTDNGGVLDLKGPDDDDCDNSRGVYCIDQKLLNLLVG